jgi:hypothetical protein
MDDVFPSTSSSAVRPKSRPSSIASRSPSPGLRNTAGGAGGMTTFFLTEENNFGVHSISDSLSSRTTPAESSREDIDSNTLPPATDTAKTDPAVPSNNVSPTVSTLSSPRPNLSSSAISEDSELDISNHEEDAASSFPQLIMPKVNMPVRKSFTETGRTMGKLKVMVVGDSGSLFKWLFADFRNWEV